MSQVRLGFQLLVWGYLICKCGSTTLDSDKVFDGNWVLKDSSSATLLCKISPFTGALIWRFNNIKVAECTLKYCRQFSTGDGAFMFGFDTENGFFEFTINPVDMKKHNGKTIQCYDGTDTFNVTATVTESEVLQTGTGNTSTNDGLLLAILVYVVISTCMLGVGIIIVIWKLVLNQSETSQKTGNTINNTPLHEEGSTDTQSLTDVHIQQINASCIQPLTNTLNNQHKKMMEAVKKLSKVIKDYIERKNETDENLTSNTDLNLEEKRNLNERLDSNDSKQGGSEDDDKSDGSPSNVTVQNADDLNP